MAHLLVWVGILDQRTPFQMTIQLLQSTFDHVTRSSAVQTTDRVNLRSRQTRAMATTHGKRSTNRETTVA